MAEKKDSSQNRNISGQMVYFIHFPIFPSPNLLSLSFFFMKKIYSSLKVYPLTICPETPFLQFHGKLTMEHHRE